MPRTESPLLQWVVEPVSNAWAAASIHGSNFEFPLSLETFLFIFWARLYIYICSCSILNGTSICLKWKRRCPGSTQSSYLMEINFAFTWNILIVDLVLVFYAEWFPWGKGLYSIHLCFYLLNRWTSHLCPHFTLAIFWCYWILLAADRVFATFSIYNTNIWNCSDL